MARYAVIDQGNIVINIIIWDGAPWEPPANTILVQSDSANIGDTYNSQTGIFTPPAPA